jgi:hypothetical protein
VPTALESPVEPGSNPWERRAWLLLGLLLASLWIYKLRDLRLPYFWDELGVYARAAIYLHDHALGLLPSDLPPDLSRGHPLLLAFLFGGFLRLFGATPLVAHVGVLLVSTGLVVSVFWIARRWWGLTPGLVAATLLLAQPLFLAQSTLLLPEVPMALACLWALHTYLRRRYLVAAVWIWVAIFVKETAVVLVPVLGLVLLVQARRQRPKRRQVAFGMLALALPAALYGAFLLVQKHQNGWYLFPAHASQVSFRWSAIREGLRIGIAFVFSEQGRLGLTFAIGMWLVIRLFAPRSSESRRGEGFVACLALFVGAFLVFSAGNVFMKRYLLCLLPPLALVAGRALSDLVREGPRLIVPVTVGLCLWCLGERASPGFNCAYDMAYRESVLEQAQATRYLQDTISPDKAILANFPTVFALEDPRYGYVRRRFARCSYRYSPEDEYIFASELYDPFSPPAGIRTQLLRRFASPYMNIALYRIVH